MPVRTWVGRFTVDERGVREEGRWLGSLIRQRPDEEADELYVLVEPASHDGAEFGAQIVDVVGQLYSRDPLSLTGALTRSVKAAHDHLRAWNRTSLREHRVGAGTSCLALRGCDAYLLQAGPSLAYVLRARGDFHRLQPERADVEHSLGMDDAFDPRLVRLALAPGDLVVLASSALDAIADADHVQHILERGADEALPELYLLCRDQPDFSLVLLSCFDEKETPPEFLTRACEAVGVSRNGNGASGDDDAAADGLVLVGVPEGDDAPEPATASVATAMVEGGDMARPAQPMPAREQVREIAQTAPPPPPAGVRLRGGDAAPRYRKKVGAADPLRRLRVPPIAVLAALVLAVVVAIAWWPLRDSLRADREDRFATLLLDARQANAQAQATGDAGAKRELLTTAKAKLTDATKIHRDDGELSALSSDVTAALTLLDAVYEVKDFTPVADLAQQVTGQLSVTRSVIGGPNAYFLDVEGRRVLRLPLGGSAAPETIFQEGELAGVVTTGRPAQIAWSDDVKALLMIDDRRQAFVYFADRGALPMTVHGADAWSSLDAVTASGGNLYVLDVKGNQVWRYLPGQGGFASERTPLLGDADLRDATEIAVGQDLYVLDSRRGVRRFVGATETPFALAGIDMPLVSPASLTVLPGSNRLVLADRGNKRIVVASADGVFLRQIVSPSFTDLKAAAVDEGSGTLYVLNGDTLLKAAFPP